MRRNPTPGFAGGWPSSSMRNFRLNRPFAWVAQWIEQKFPKLLVGGSIPLPGTIFTLPNALGGPIRIFNPLLWIHRQS